MFDISFLELCLIGIVALIVFGPDKLPQVARTTGMWVGRARHFLTTIKQDIDRELQLQELKNTIKPDEKADLQQLAKETQESLTIPTIPVQKPIIIPTTPVLNLVDKPVSPVDVSSPPQQS